MYSLLIPTEKDINWVEIIKLATNQNYYFVILIFQCEGKAIQIFCFSLLFFLDAFSLSLINAQIIGGLLSSSFQIPQWNVL